MIRQLKIFFFPTLLFLVHGCAGSISSIYDSSYPLSDETAKSKSAQLTVKVPQDWFVAENDENNSVDLWLVNQDYSATLNFVPLNLDSVIIKSIHGDELNSIVKFSQIFRKAQFGKTMNEFIHQEVFEMNGKKFAAYEYADDSKRAVRVVVFRSGDKYYELSAIPFKNQNPFELYKIQNSVLSSIN